jgi:uncharacterized glyoxalase superfamily protein PhnB
MTTQRPAKPTHSTWLTPFLTITDLSKAIAFYVDAFGFDRCEEVEEAVHEGTVIHAAMKYKGQAVFMMIAEGAFGQDIPTPKHSKLDSPMSLYVYVENVDSWYENAKKHGVEILDEPETMFWGDRTCRVKDLDGYHWIFATNVADDQPMPKGDFRCE